MFYFSLEQYDIRKKTSIMKGKYGCYRGIYYLSIIHGIHTFLQNIDNSYIKYAQALHRKKELYEFFY